ncbi:hypothetical protein FQA39_LY05964 [Lamprigera yunnana]|nr:hypothetical protein FQA39_LY05964 [Lamprigera yunnana]
MESAAMEAYRKDIELNADLTSININNMTQDLSGRNLWHEVKSQGGEISYRNVITNETVWKPPQEGYLTLTEQKLASFEKTKKQMKLAQKQQMFEGRLRWEALKKREEEERARKAREKLKERQAEPLPEPVYAPLLPTEPSTPYGTWQTIRTEIVNQIDWQLPQQEEYLPAVVSEPEPEPTPRVFKEKVIESLEGGSATFKKRKFCGGASRNARQRLDDD